MVKKITFCFLLLLINSFASEFYLQNNDSLYQLKKHQNQLGIVNFATKVNLIKKENTYSKIKITGWILDENEDVIYKDYGIINELLVLNKINKNLFTYEDRITDEYGDIWNKISIIGWVKNTSLTKSLDTKWKKISKLYKTTCGACHKVHKAKEFEANAWPGLLGAMGDRAGLTPNTKEKVLKYLQEHAKK